MFRVSDSPAAVSANIQSFILYNNSITLTGVRVLGCLLEAADIPLFSEFQERIQIYIFPWGLRFEGIIAFTIPIEPIKIVFWNRGNV